MAGCLVSVNDVELEMVDGEGGGQGVERDRDDGDDG